MVDVSQKFTPKYESVNNSISAKKEDVLPQLKKQLGGRTGLPVVSHKYQPVKSRGPLEEQKVEQAPAFEEPKRSSDPFGEQIGLFTQIFPFSKTTEALSTQANRF